MTRWARSGVAFALVMATACTSAQPTTEHRYPTTEDGYEELRSAIEKNWNLPTGVSNVEKYTVSLRLFMTPDSVVTKIEVLDDTGDPGFRTLAESARRAVVITQHELGRLPIPKDKYSPTIVLRWPMKLICEQRGGC